MLIKRKAKEIITNRAIRVILTTQTEFPSINWMLRSNRYIVGSSQRRQTVDSFTICT